jgi:BirA family biotin operon repressor/biotin-[acetyl-CoA-carboxylase] ligase
MGLAAAEAVSAEAEAHGAETHGAEKHGVECVVGLKWPNDLMIGGRKVGGVLVGAETDGKRITQAVLSLGLNANLSVRDLPEEVRESATTLRDETGQEHRIEVLAARVLENLERAWPEIVGGGEELAEKWRARDVLMGREVSAEVGGAAVRGRASGIDADGALVIAASGGERRVFAGEAAAVRIVSR